MSFTQDYLKEAAEVLKRIDAASVEAVAGWIGKVRERGGRIFVVGVGGSAGNASHFVNDLRKIAGIEAYTPTDNVSELTARINDDGWTRVFADWLAVSRLGKLDALFVLSVGGGDEARGISPNLVEAVKLAKASGAAVLGLVGRDGGYTARNADACVVVPVVNPNTVTSHTEAFQSVLWHLLVTHPGVKKNPTKWESVQGG